MRFYLDSNVLISALREEIGGNFRLLAAEADCFFKYAAKSKATIVLSDFCFSEIKKKIHLGKESVIDYLNSININAEIVDSSIEDMKEAGKIERTGIHPQDSRHVAIALRTKCNCIITFNTRDFELVNHLIKIKDPAEFR